VELVQENDQLLEVADSGLLKYRPPRVHVDKDVVRNVEIPNVCVLRLVGLAMAL
jgi:hypothetical protein